MNGKNGGNGQMTAKAQSRLGWLQVLSFMLVVLMVASIMLNLSEVVRGLDSSLVWPVSGLGLLFGLLLVRFATRTWSAWLLSFTGGTLLVAMMVGRLWDDWAAFFNQLGVYFSSLFAAWRGGLIAPTLGTAYYFLKLFADGAFAMFNRLFLWFKLFPNMNNDLVASLMVWNLAIWLAMIWLAWFLWRRNRPLEAALPSLLLLGVARSYAGDSGNAILFSMGVTLALMIMFNQINRERWWSEKGVGFSELIRKNSTQAAMLLSVSLVVVSAGITSIDVQELAERWREYQRERNRVSDGSTGVGGQNPGIIKVPEDDDRVTLAEQYGKLTRGGMPNRHLIGSGPELSDQVVMVVDLEEIDPQSGNFIPVDRTDSQFFYFRSLTYDQYTTFGWNSVGGKIYVYQPEQTAISSYTNRQKLLRQAVVYREYEAGLVHAVGELAVVDRQYSIAWREGEGLSSFRDMFGATVESRGYEAFSLIPVYGEDDLRATYQNYPNWVINRYLQLPDTVPQRVLDLAYELTSTELNPYDQAVAIEQYLRTFPYTLDLPTKPGNADIADYFLFELKRGYCDYYATTMVVLARAAGLPARLAVGFVGGNYIEETGLYTITADMAHAWVEVYFSDYGWVTFEPTGGRAPIERVVGKKVVTEEFEKQVLFVEEKIPLAISTIVQRVLLGIFGSGLLITMVWLRVDLWTLRRQTPEKAFARLYRRLIWFGARVGVVKGEAQTPNEFSAELQARITHLRQGSKLLSRLPNAVALVGVMVGHTNQLAYSLEPPGAFERAQAVRAWAELRWHLAMAAIWLWLSKLPTLHLRKKGAEDDALD